MYIGYNVQYFIFIYINVNVDIICFMAIILSITYCDYICIPVFYINFYGYNIMWVYKYIYNI